MTGNIVGAIANMMGVIRADIRVMAIRAMAKATAMADSMATITAVTVEMDAVEAGVMARETGNLLLFLKTQIRKMIKHQPCVIRAMAM